VAGDAMEMRGGNGYIEEWIEPRLLRETHLGSIWEGTSNIIALDVVRAAGRAGAHRALARCLRTMLGVVLEDVVEKLVERLDAALALLERVGREGGDARGARQAATGLYHATAAILFAYEAEQLGDPVRLDLARLVQAHKLSPRDPLAGSSPDEEAAADRVIDALVTARMNWGQTLRV
jgi:acyl-CoA dehydrogenase-like protein